MNKRITNLFVLFDEDRVSNLYEDCSVLQDINSLSSLLKMYFRELPNPVCTYHLYNKFIVQVVGAHGGWQLLEVHLEQ